MLLTPEEAGAVLEVGLEGDCYVDPLLSHNPIKYHEFISDLIDCNLLYFCKMYSFHMAPCDFPCM